MAQGGQRRPDDRDGSARAGMIDRRLAVGIGLRSEWASSDAYERYNGRWSRLVADQFVGARRAARAAIVGCRLWDGRPDRRDPEAIRSERGHRHRSGGAVHRAGRDDAAGPRATFRLGSADETGFPDGALDVVVGGFVLNFVPDVGAALGEWRRFLSPGGVVGPPCGTTPWHGIHPSVLDSAVSVDPAAAAFDQGRRRAS